MAVLSQQEREALFAVFNSDASLMREIIGVGKVDLRAAVDAVDGWIDANMASFNTALPQPARGALTTKQKVRLLLFVVQKRWEVS